MVLSTIRNSLPNRLRDPTCSDILRNYLKRIYLRVIKHTQCSYRFFMILRFINSRLTLILTLKPTNEIRFFVKLKVKAAT